LKACSELVFKLVFNILRMLKLVTLNILRYNATIKVAPKIKLGIIMTNFCEPIRNYVPAMNTFH